MAASTKVQLGARVAPEVRAAAVEAAKDAGQSLNVWVERALAAALSSHLAGSASQRDADVAQSVERHLAKVEVAGSKPAVRLSVAEQMAAQAVANEEERRRIARTR